MWEWRRHGINMKPHLLFTWLIVSALLSVSIVVKAVDDTYAYQMLSFNDGTDNFEGWTRTDEGDFKIYSTRLPANYTKLGLSLWAFSEGAAYPGNVIFTSCFPYVFPVSIEVRKESQSEWSPVTLGDNVFFNIPDGYDQIRVTFKKWAPKVMTLGLAIEQTEEIKITEFPDMDILTGRLSDRGIQAVGGQNQVVEVSIPCTSASGLSQAYAKINYAAYYVEDYGFDETETINFFPSSVTATAVTTDGLNVPIKLYGIESPFGMLCLEDAGLLPLNTVALRIRWDFTDVPSFYTWDDELLEEKLCYASVYITSSERGGTDFLNNITQAAGPGIPTESPVTTDMHLITDPAVWYDIDGDGIKEWVVAPYSRFENNTYRTYGGLSKFNADYAGYRSINNQFPVISGWVKYSSGAGIGAYSKTDKKIYVVDETDATLVAETEYAPALLDFNNDGRPDFWLDSNGSNTPVPDHILTADANGTLQTENLMTITPQEYYNYVISKPSSGLGSGLSFVGDTPDKSKTPGSFSTYDLIDLNNDGYLDFVNGTTGRYLLNTGDGRYMDDTFGGTVVFRDFDGDGITDMLSYDDEEKSVSVYLQRFDGNTVKQQLFKGLNCGKHVWCRDFDRDGDVDILIPFNGSDNGGMSYLVMFENTGNGKFKKHENFIDGGFDFHAMTDWNADGRYEIISVVTNPNRKMRSVKSFTIDGMKVDSTPYDLGTLEISSYTSDKDIYNILIGDVDNSGQTRIIFTDGMLTPQMPQRNSRPQQPHSPVIVYDASSETATISWITGNDRETAPADLTYELRIGTAEGLGDLVYAYAAADGTRLNMLQGNCGYSLHRRFNTSSWPQGKIYVSVQAIDDSGLGSEFSQPAVFEKRQPAASFTLTTPDIVTVGDQLTLHIISVQSEDHHVSWNLDGAEVISQTDNEMVISYSSTGKKNITLTITDDNGNSALQTRSVSIVPAKATVYPYDSAGLPYYSIWAAFDMDLDGKTELMSSLQTSGYGPAFFEGDENGIYTPVRRLFNTAVNCTFNGQIPQVVDINRDGLPDIFVGGYDGTSYIAHFINEDDKSMQYNRFDTKDNSVSIKQSIVDFDNDGLKDIPTGRNTGDYITFTRELNGEMNGNQYYTDLNGDGLVDIITIESGKMKIYANKGNFNFELVETVEEENLWDYGYIGDFDGNGKADYAWDLSGSGHGISWYSDNMFVRWDDGNITKIPAPDGTRYFGIKAMFDFDNNGCQDIIVATDSDFFVMIFFHPDRSYEIVKIPRESIEKVVYLRTDGRLGMGHSIITCKPNTAPTPPTGLRVAQNSKSVIIEWNRATDAETPSAALCYNISVKKVGVEGEGAYLISPLNGGKNGVPVPSNTLLLPSTMFTIPLSSIAEGEYKVKVQAVDTQWQQGDFSETVKFSVVATAAVEMPTATMVGSSVQIFINAGFTVNDIDFGADAHVESATGNTATVYWTSEGLKEVKAGKFVSQIYVHPRLDASFDIPETIYEGDKVLLHSDNTHLDLWEASTGYLEQHIRFAPISEIPAVRMQVIDDNTAELCITSVAGGTWNLRHTITESYGTDEYRTRVSVTRHPEMPAIRLVDIDEATGKHRLSWNVPSHLQGMATHVNIYKETARTGDYRLIAVCPVNDSEYIDSESFPAVVASRYAISFVTSYGETGMSENHRPIHVMINKGTGNSWNLSWGKYEGRDIATYRILRGTSPESLRYIDEVSGGISSYTDLAAPAGECYYAIEILIDTPSQQTLKRSSVSGSTVSRSNIVSTADAGSVLFATGINVISETGLFHINASESLTLQLLAQIFPVNVSLHHVDWVVKSGSDVVSVNESGLVTAIGNGTAVVAAYATDGSGVYGEITITVGEISGIEKVADGNVVGKLSLTRIGTDILVSGIAADDENPALIRIYNMNGVVMETMSTSNECEKIEISHLRTGVYIVCAMNGNSLQTARFMIR